MKVGVLGTGEVGRSLGKAFIGLGHEVRMGGREATNEKAAAFAREYGAQASAGSFRDAAEFGELIVLCTLGGALPEVLAQAGPEHFTDKIVLDTTNPLDFSRGFPPSLLALPQGSGGEQVQSILPAAKVVKVFNTINNTLMFRPDLPGGPPTMFFCGNDQAAKQSVATLLVEFGHEPADVGPITSSRYLEGMCIVWSMCGGKSVGWNHAFKMLRK